MSWHICRFDLACRQRDCQCLKLLQKVESSNDAWQKRDRANQDRGNPETDRWSEVSGRAAHLPQRRGRRGGGTKCFKTELAFDKAMAGLINPRQIYAFGLNYVDHAKESNLPLPTEPFFFLKAASSLQRDGGVVEYPPSVSTLFYETELGVVIGAGGRDISEADAMKHVAGAPRTVLVQSRWLNRFARAESCLSILSPSRPLPPSLRVHSQATSWRST